ncbi:MAG: hypothetical protein IT435_05660 [Phycisphaerales bacterium]|nr:hypothetical protein [Phycisphaerales bacterium]
MSHEHAPHQGADVATARQLLDHIGHIVAAHRCRQISAPTAVRLIYGAASAACTAVRDHPDFCQDHACRCVVLAFHPEPPVPKDSAMQIRFDTTQKDHVPFTVTNPTTGADVPYTNPRWESSDETVATIEEDSDGKGAFIVSGAPGFCTISLTVEVDFGAGPHDISGSLDCQIDESGQAVITFSPEPPVSKTA